MSVIESFWDENDAPQGYDRLLDELGDTVIPTLERFPALGRSLFAYPPDSSEAMVRLDRLRVRLAGLGDSDIREYVMTEYLLLYAVVNESVYLLSIRHHKQLSFDFAHLWRE